MSLWPDYIVCIAVPAVIENMILAWKALKRLEKEERHD